MYFTQLHLKRSFIMIGSILLLAVLVLTMVAYRESTHALAARHAPSTPLLTIKGSGIKQTATFTVPSTWTITWACKPTSFNGFNYNVIVYVYRSNGALADVAINAICSHPYFFPLALIPQTIFRSLGEKHGTLCPHGLFLFFSRLVADGRLGTDGPLARGDPVLTALCIER